MMNTDSTTRNIEKTLAQTRANSCSAHSIFARTTSSIHSSPEKISKLSNKELHKLAQEYGGNARKWQKAFATLLPEIDTRRIFRDHGCHTVYEYAAKLCGMSQPTVDEILTTCSKLKDKPILLNLMMEYGWSKLKVIANIATVETQNFWAEKVQQMSRDTLGTFVHELRKQKEMETNNFQNTTLVSNEQKYELSSKSAPNSETGNGQIELFTNVSDIESLRTGESTPAEVSQKSAITFRLDEATEVRLRVFKQKLEKQTRIPEDWNQVINELLDRAEKEALISNFNSKFKKIPDETPQAKQHNPKLKSESAQEDVQELTIPPKMQETEASYGPPTRHIPAHILRALEQKYHGKCAYPTCTKPAEIKHHTLRFSLNPSHNANFIAPLCKEHERLAHLGLIKNEEFAPDFWEIKPHADETVPKYGIDLIVQKFRKQTWS